MGKHNQDSVCRWHKQCAMPQLGCLEKVCFDPNVNLKERIMECRININGDLIVEAMSETEAFALDKWESFFKNNDSAIKLIVKPAGAYWDAENNTITVYKNEAE